MIRESHVVWRVKRAATGRGFVFFGQIPAWFQSLRVRLIFALFVTKPVYVTGRL